MTAMPLTTYSSGLMGLGQKNLNPPVVMGDESMMDEKGHGTYTKPVQQDLRCACVAVSRSISSTSGKGSDCLIALPGACRGGQLS